MSAYIDPYVRSIFRSDPNGTHLVKLKVPSDVVPDLSRTPNVQVARSGPGFMLVRVMGKRALDALEQTPNILTIEMP